MSFQYVTRPMPTNHQRYLVIDYFTGEIIDDNHGQGFADKITAAIAIAKQNNHNYCQANWDKTAIRQWWQQHITLWQQLDELHAEEETSQQVIMDYPLFRQLMIQSGYPINLPFQLLWQNYPTQNPLTTGFIFATISTHDRCEIYQRVLYIKRPSPN